MIVIILVIYEAKIIYVQVWKLAFQMVFLKKNKNVWKNYASSKRIIIKFREKMNFWAV